MLRQSIRRARRRSFLAHLENLEPRWLLSTSSTDPSSALVSSGAAISQPAEPGATIALPGGASMANPVYGSTFRSALTGGVGYWDDPASWSAGRAPTATDNVIIQAGDTIIVRDTNAIAQAIGVYAGGTLQYATNVNTELKVVTLVVLGEFDMGTAATPIDAAVTAKLTIRNVAIDTTADPGSWGNGLVGLGTIRIFGATKDVSDNRLTVEPHVGDTTLTFQHDVTGWRAGDKLYIPGTAQLASDAYSTGTSLQWENATIASVAGNVVTLTSALTYNHLGARNSTGQLEFMPAIQNLSRNAIVRSESPTGTRGHTLFAGRADVDIRYALFGGLGRSQIGDSSNFRVAVQFYHLIGPTTPQANGYQYTFIGNAITCPLDPMPFKWGLLVDESDFGLIQNNDINNWAGAGLVTLTGAETQNVIDGNRVMRINGDGHRIDDTGESGTGFWLRGPDNYVRNNVAANIHGGIYNYGFNTMMQYVGTVTLPAYQGADPSVAGQSVSVNMNYTPFREFRNNETFASQNGMTIWWLGTNFETPGDVESHLQDMKIWNTYQWGIFFYESSRLTVDNLRFISSDTTNQPKAFKFADYMTRQFVLENSRIENGWIELPLNADVRGTSSSDQTVGRFTIKDTTFVGGDIEGGEPSSVNGSTDLSKRVALLMNVRFVNPTGQTFTLNTDSDPSLGTPNTSVANYAVVQNYNSAPGVSGSDFLVYSTYQTGPGTQQPSMAQIDGKIYNLTDATPPTISNVAVSNLTGTSATIGWTTNENSAFQVVYGTSTSYGSYQTHAGFATSRSFALTGLLPGTTYHYRVTSWDVYGNLSSSGDLTFTTPGIDVTPPVESNVAASGVTTTAANISWTTDEASDTQVEYGTTTAYGSSTTLNTALVTNHSALLSGLALATTYHYRVKSRDAAGNLAVSGDFTFTTAASADTTPPVISGVGTSNLSSSGLTIAWTTNEAADTQVDYGTTTAYGSSTTLNTTLITGHSVNLSGLAASTTYHYRVKSHDAAGNLAVSGDFTITTAAAPDTTPPVISGVGTSNLSSSGLTIAWTTNESSDTQIDYGTTTAYGSSTTLNTALVTSHSVSMSGLAASTTYHYRVKSRDAAGNLQTSADFTVTTAAAPDTTPPVISAVTAANVLVTSATIGWTTNEPADTQVDYGTTTAYGSSTTLNTSLLTTHSTTLSGLTAGTVYHYHVKSRDAAGNLQVSSDFTFTTATAGVVRIMDDGDTTNRLIGTWTHVTGRGYANDFHRAAKGNGSNTSTWTFWNVANGKYQVWATWKTTSINATNAPYTVFDGTTAKFTTRVDQLVAPNGLSSNGTLWQSIGVVTISSGKLIVKLTNAANNQVVADAIRIQQIVSSPLPSPFDLPASSDQSVAATVPASTIYSYNNPPPLPPSDPATMVTVSDVNQLINAVNNLQTGQTISIAAGTYNLTGLTDALYIPQGISNWTVRGATGNRDDVVIQGAGMSGSVVYGFWTNSPGGTIADLTIDGVKTHGIIANYGASNLLIHNVHVIDAGDQSVKSNPDSTNTQGNNNGIVEYSVFEYRTTDTDNYTNGVDVHTGSGWIVRYNLFKNFLSPAGQGIAGPAVLFWNGSSNNTVEGNTFINDARGISMGLVDKAGGFDNQGGLVENNFFYRDPNLPQQVDVPIYVADSPNTNVFHNTVIAQGSYPNAIEYRFASTTGTSIKNNLTDGAIVTRDGATGTLAGNLTNATLSYFVNPAAGDLHLVAGAAPINQGVTNVGVTIDVDGESRDAQPDVGADEFVSGSSDNTPPTISTVAASSASSSGVTITWTTNEAADSQVEYGTTTAYGSSTTVNALTVTTHSVNLTGLTAGTTYHYRVKSRDAAGNLQTSPDFTFTTAPTTAARILDDGDMTNRLVGTWTHVTGRGYANDFHKAANGNGSISSTWTFWNVPNGQYQVWVTWKSASNNATNAPFTVYDGSVAKFTMRVNQLVAPSGLTANGAVWKALGLVTISGGKLVVKLTNAANNQVVADAVRIEQIVQAPVPGPLNMNEAPLVPVVPSQSTAVLTDATVSTLPTSAFLAQSSLDDAVDQLIQSSAQEQADNSLQQLAADQLSLDSLLSPLATSL